MQPASCLPKLSMVIKPPCHPQPTGESVEGSQNVPCLLPIFPPKAEELIQEYSPRQNNPRGTHQTFTASSNILSRHLPLVTQFRTKLNSASHVMEHQPTNTSPTNVYILQIPENQPTFKCVFGGGGLTLQLRLQSIINPEPGRGL